MLGLLVGLGVDATIGLPDGSVLTLGATDVVLDGLEDRDALGNELGLSEGDSVGPITG